MSRDVFKLNDQEQRILRDIIFARSKVLGSWDAEDITVVPMYTELRESNVRQALVVFDFFRCAYAGNMEGLKHQTAVLQNKEPYAGGRYYDGLIHDYREVMNTLMGDCYTTEDISMLQNRMKGYLKEQKSPPPRILYIADCHFYHDRICHEMDSRGFSGFEKMNEHMIRQWNAKAKPKDDVYILGDFCIAKGDSATKVLNQLNGKLHLIIGNHDRYLEDKHFDRSWFRSIEYYQEIRDKGRTVILSHYPVFCYKGQYRRDTEGRPLVYMLYGHVHDTHDERLVHRFIRETQALKVMSRHAKEPEPIPCNMINCFCMFSNYQPMTLDEWIEIDRKRRKAMDGTASRTSFA